MNYLHSIFHQKSTLDVKDSRKSFIQSCVYKHKENYFKIRIIKCQPSQLCRKVLKN